MPPFQRDEDGDKSRLDENGNPTSSCVNGGSGSGPYPIMDPQLRPLSIYRSVSLLLILAQSCVVTVRMCCEPFEVLVLNDVTMFVSDTPPSFILTSFEFPAHNLTSHTTRKRIKQRRRGKQDGKRFKCIQNVDVDLRKNLET